MDQRRPADLQHDAGLSARRRANSPVTALVSVSAAPTVCWWPASLVSSAWQDCCSGGVDILCWTIADHAVWLGIIAVFIADELLARFEASPGAGHASPKCRAAKALPVPPARPRRRSGELWRCGKCGQAFDTFLTQGVCPHCGTQFNAHAMPGLRNFAVPIGEWITVRRAIQLIFQSSALNAREIRSRTACFGFFPS